MARVIRCKDGRICVEFQGDLDAIRDQDGRWTTFAYLSPAEADELYVALGQEILDEDFKRMEKRKNILGIIPWPQ